MSEKIFVIPPARTRYLSEISENNRAYDNFVEQQAEVPQKLYGICMTISGLAGHVGLNSSGLECEGVSEANKELVELLLKEFDREKMNLDPHNWESVIQWESKVEKYKAPEFSFMVRSIKYELKIKTPYRIPFTYTDPENSYPANIRPGEIFCGGCLQENVPGEFPYTAGLFPFKREGEDPTRMFAGEGGPERTNQEIPLREPARMPAKRLSTAFDSVTLYGNDPDHRPDIYGKIGNSGVSICCLDDAKKLYSGFRPFGSEDLCVHDH